MKNLLNTIISSLVCYVLISFIVWDASISNWGWFARLVYLIANLVIVTYTDDDEE